jgi:hypothetical protein
VQYVITTTVTNTVMTAPFVAANGPINYVGGASVGPTTTNTSTNDAATNTTAGNGVSTSTTAVSPTRRPPSSTKLSIRCALAPTKRGSTTITLTCYVTAAARATAHTSGGSGVKLACSLARTAKDTKASARVTHGKRAKPVKASRTQPVRYVYACRTKV